MAQSGTKNMELPLEDICSSVSVERVDDISKAGRPAQSLRLAKFSLQGFRCIMSKA